MNLIPDRSLTENRHVVRDVVLLEADRWIVRQELLIDVLRYHELHNLPRFGIRLRHANDPASLITFSETALKVLFADIQYYNEMANESLKALRLLKDEIPKITLSVIEEIRKATRRVTLPPERRRILFPIVNEAMNIILRGIENLIWMSEDGRAKLKKPMLWLESRVRYALEQIHDYAREKNVTGLTNEQVLLDCRNAVLRYMTPVASSIVQHDVMLDEASKCIMVKSAFLENRVMDARKMIQTARNIVLQCSGQLASSQVDQIMNALHKAMDFTKSRALFDLEYNMSMAFYRLGHLCRTLVDY